MKWPKRPLMDSNYVSAMRLSWSFGAKFKVCMGRADGSWKEFLKSSVGRAASTLVCRRRFSFRRIFWGAGGAEALRGSAKALDSNSSTISLCRGERGTKSCWL